MKTKVMLLLVGLLIILLNCSNGSKNLLKEFKNSDSKVLVCPVHILSNQESYYSNELSEKIVEYINENIYASASLTEYSPPAYNKWLKNEAKILTNSIELSSEFVKGLNLPNDTYILYPEFLKRGQDLRIFAVHYSLLNYEGEVVIRGLINSKWPEFQSVNPKTDEDCVAVFINGFEEHMKK